MTNQEECPMKQLSLFANHFKELEIEFGNWLNTLGYSPSTVSTFPIHLNEFFHYLEQAGVSHIKQVDPHHVTCFIHHLNQRKNLRYGGKLSASYINKCIQAINTFTTFLNQTTHMGINFYAQRMENEIEERVILSMDEVDRLYQATFKAKRLNPVAFGQRDRAIIAIFYGCGLRKDEGTRLNLSDFDMERNLLFVRKGKGNKQRYVPIASKHKDDIVIYLQEGREWFFRDHEQAKYNNRYKVPKFERNTHNDPFFINERGERLLSFYSRLAILKERAGIGKSFGLHSLRHSIATHLLQRGMLIQDIARFLGHSNIESTQVYTHLAKLAHHENTNIPTEHILLLLSENKSIHTKKHS